MFTALPKRDSHSKLDLAVLPLYFSFFLLSFFSFSAEGQIYLVKDLCTYTDHSNPGGFTTLVPNGTIYFTASDGAHGREIWLTDGSANGTFLLKDINPGPADGTNEGNFELCAYNGMLYFFATDGVHGYGLWRSDGTAGGTALFKDFNMGAIHPHAWFKVLNGILFLSADDGIHGTELWRTDGTVAGTSMVKDIIPGSGSSYAYPGFIWNGAMYFGVQNGGSGDLWKSDGTEAGTVRVKILSGGNPESMFVLNNNLYFFASQGSYAYSLWESDGTATGTAIVTTITGNYSPPPSYPVILNGVGYFAAGDIANGYEFWRTDGTAAGTYLVKDVNPGNESSNPAGITVLNGNLYFNATDTTYGTEIWKSDGTTAGTALLKDIYPGSYWDNINYPIPTQIFYNSNPERIVNYNGALYFTATDSAHGRELWKTDGTPQGTVLLKDIIPGISGSLDFGSAHLTVINGLMYFEASDGPEGIELWKSDGTAAGTVMVKDINLYGGASGSGPGFLTAINENVFFTANDGRSNLGRELWKSDGTPGGTQMVKDIIPGPGSASIQSLTTFYDKLMFTADDGVHGRELWISDGTDAGTFMLKDINPGSGSSLFTNVPMLALTDTAFYFTADDGVHGIELWKTDGTPAGTVLVKDIRPGSLNAGITSMIVSGGLVYFNASDGVNGSELWKSDGTVAGTVMVKDIVPGSGGTYMHDFADANGVMYFSANSDAAGDELWKSDGTAAGTVMVKDINPLSSGTNIYKKININGTLYFAASDFVHGYALWKSDGTAAGTIIQTSNGSNAPVFAQTNLYNVNGILFFSARDVTYGTELWKSNGTDTGTYLIKDIAPGITNGFNNYEIRVVNGVGYFAAYDVVHGSELWRSDGTNAGTYIVQDKNPGVDHFFFGGIAQTASRFFFTGTTKTAGSELYAMCTGPTGIINSNAASSQFIESGNDFMATACDAIAKITPAGNNPVWGMVTAKLWKETAVPSVGGQPFVARHYEITPDNSPTTATARITLYFTQEEFTDFNNHPASVLDLPSGPNDPIGNANLRIAKYSGISNDGTGLPASYSGIPQIINPADTAIVWNAAQSRWEVSFDVSGFSGFIVQTVTSPLPVRLVWFKGKLNTDKTVDLQWKVEDQLDISGYVVERSNDGSHFADIGTVPANQFGTFTYQFTDPQQVKGNVFYRLRIIEKGGRVFYSSVILFSSNDGQMLTVFPNPARSVLYVQLNSSGRNADLAIIDQQGRQVRHLSITTNSVNAIDISTLATGAYIIRSADQQQVINYSFMKK